MRTTFIWLLLAAAVLLLGDAVNAWNRQFFNRYSRNLLRNAGGDYAGGGVGGGGGGGSVADSIGFGGNGVAGAAIGAGNYVGGVGNTQFDDFNTIFGLNNDVGLRASSGINGAGNIGGIGGVNGVSNNAGTTAIGYSYGTALNNDVDALNFAAQQQQPEVYGIVEPLIEDTPCVDRLCQVNDDCCPTGVCVNTYGEGKCIYVYGRKRDLCHRNTDCEPGTSCLKSSAGNLMCQAAPAMHLLNMGVGNGVGSGGSGSSGGGGIATATGIANSAITGLGLSPAAAKSLELKQFGEDCTSSSDCNVTKGMCCQLQRSHHRMRPRKLCAYFRDPFMCIDIMPTEDEEIRESRFLSAFSQRRM